MAWHIPKEKMNNNPLSQDEAELRFKKYGLTLLDIYQNNRTRCHCINSDGYKVMATLDSLGKVKEYARFSPTANADGFIFNTNKWMIENNINLIVKDWFYPDDKHSSLLKVKCICGECGNEFITRWNQIKTGQCVRCQECSSKMSNIAKMVESYLINSNIEYIKEYRFDDCRDIKTLPFDFYLPLLNCCIEVDGEQHFSSRCRFRKLDEQSAIDNFNIIQLHDKIKNEYCEANNISLIRLKYDEIRDDSYIKILNKLLQG